MGFHYLRKGIALFSLLLMSFSLFASVMTPYVEKVDPEEFYNGATFDIGPGNFNNEEFARDPAGFVRIWLSLLVKYPGSYGTAFLYHTMGSWYLTDTSHCMVYKDWWRDRTGYFITDAVPVFAGDFVRKENLCPRVRDFYEAIATDCIHQRFLPLRILFSPAFFCFCTAFCCLGLCLRRHSLYWIPALAVLLYLATVVAGPCILVRYIYPFMVLLPFLAVLTLSGQNRVLETAFDT